MTFPDYLITGYNLAQQSKLVAGDTSDEALTEFAKILNRARLPHMPNSNASRSLERGDRATTHLRDKPLFDIVQALFRANRRGYIACIRNTTNEPTVLWTEPRAIVHWFELSRRVYIKEDRNGYFMVRPITQTDAPTEVRQRAQNTSHRRNTQRRGAIAPSEDLPLADFPVLDGDEIVMGKQ
jgi:hypothetical protein